MSWIIAGNSVEPTPEIELTASTLSVAFEIDETDLSTWEALGDRAGDLAVETGFGGAFRTLARGTQGPVTVVPAASESPPIATNDWYVAGFETEQLSPRRHRVSLELQRPANRRDDEGFGINFGRNFGSGDQFGGLTEDDVSAADQGFGIDFGRDFGAGDPDLPLYLSLQDGEGLTLGVTARQLGQVSREGVATGATVAIPLLLSGEQTAALADAASHPAGVVEQAVPDGESRLVDESGGRQTVTIDTRTTIDLADGDWLLTDWTVSWHSYTTDRRWRVELALAETT
jgi:hypothetical protein